MTAKELRIGNFIKDRGGKIIRVDFLEHIQDGYDTKFGRIVFLEGTEVHPMTEYTDYAEPIQLTEEWLFKFGFELWIEGGHYKMRTDNIFDGESVSYYLPYFSMNISIGEVHIKYVHQLQNLYYALTGEELKLTK